MYSNAPLNIDTILLCGSGRSGTTWLADIICANPRYRTVFEPFDYRRVPEMAPLPLFAYARPTNEYPERETLVQSALLGKLENAWVDRMGRRPWARKLLVKSIRANLMLGWIDRKFSPRILFTIRHPCAVVQSRMRLGWDTHIDVLVGQAELVEDYLQRYMDLILSATTDLQKQTVMWCIENLVPLRQLSSHAWVFATYENLYLAPELEVKRILSALGLRPSLLTRRAVSKLSIATGANSPLLQGESPITAWKKSMTAAEVDEVLSIVHDFGITLYTHEPTPESSSLSG